MLCNYSYFIFAVKNNYEQNKLWIHTLQMRIVTLLRHQAVLQIIDLIKSYIFLLIFLLKQHTSMVHYALHRNTHEIPLVISTSRFFPHVWLITEFVTRVAWRVPLMEQKLLTLLDHLSSPLVFSRARVAQSLVFCVALCRSLSVRSKSKPDLHK
jgi:hypothetical protein